LALEQRDYINGKKNGKINKIIKSSACKITFQEYNGYNMLIDLCNQYSTKALEGLAMLEVSLYIYSKQFTRNTFYINFTNLVRMKYQQNYHSIYLNPSIKELLVLVVKIFKE